MLLSAGPRTGLAVTVVILSACTLTADDFAPNLQTAGSEPCPGANCALEESAEAGSAIATPSPSLPGSTVDSDVRGEAALPGGLPPFATPTTPTTPTTPEGSSPGPDAGAPGDIPDPAFDSVGLRGWASVPGLGVATTTGGGATPAVVAVTREELIALAARPEPMTIAIAGSLDVGELELGSNKTLIGMGNDATLRGGITIRGIAESFVANVIVRNLHIDASASEAEGDGIQVHYAHHVWIDHCAISDAADGLIDIVHGSDFITLSFNRLFYTDRAPDPSHRFANLIGHSVENGAEDAGHLNVTMHHNWWGSGVTQAVLGRFGSIHAFGNHFASAGNENVITAGLFARFLVENNYFEAVASPHAILPVSAASVLATGNVYDETTGAHDVNGSAFVPEYSYALDVAANLPALVTREAGPH
jgi:pectate lyase